MIFSIGYKRGKPSLALIDSIGRLTTPCGRFLDRHFLSSFGIWFNFLWITWICLFHAYQIISKLIYAWVMQHGSCYMSHKMRHVPWICCINRTEKCANNPLKIGFGSERFVACQTILFAWLFLVDQIIVYSLKIWLSNKPLDFI